MVYASRTLGPDYVFLAEDCVQDAVYKAYYQRHTFSGAQAFYAFFTPAFTMLRSISYASILYKRKLLESWGRGISLMAEECRKANLPEPEFKLSNGFVILVFRYNPVTPTSTRQATVQVGALIQIIQKEIYSVK